MIKSNYIEMIIRFESEISSYNKILQKVNLSKSVRESITKRVKEISKRLEIMKILRGE